MRIVAFRAPNVTLRPSIAVLSTDATINLVATLRTAARREARTVVVTAHLDLIGVLNGAKGDSVFHAADDNASGVSAFLAVAERLASLSTRTHNVRFVLTSGEERGL